MKSSKSQQNANNFLHIECIVKEVLFASVCVRERGGGDRETEKERRQVPAHSYQLHRGKF